MIRVWIWGQVGWDMGRSPFLLGVESGEAQCPLPRKFLILGSQNAYFGAFSGPSECSITSAL